jgi:hypothetical protein
VRHPWVTREVWHALAASRHACGALLEGSAGNGAMEGQSDQNEEGTGGARLAAEHDGGLLYVVRGWSAFERLGLCLRAGGGGGAPEPRAAAAAGDEGLGGLVCVRVEAVGCGVPQAHARISACLPAVQGGGVGDCAGDQGLGGGQVGARRVRALEPKEIIGYLTAGWYDSSLGKGAGLGFVSVAALRRCVRAAQGARLRVNVRNPSGSLDLLCQAFVCL